MNEWIQNETESITLKASADQLCVVGVQPLYEVLIVSAAAALLRLAADNDHIKMFITQTNKHTEQPAELYSQCHFQAAELNPDSSFPPTEWIWSWSVSARHTASGQ